MVLIIAWWLCKMLTLGEAEWRLFENFPYHLCNSSVSLKLFQKEKCSKNPCLGPVIFCAFQDLSTRLRTRGLSIWQRTSPGDERTSYFQVGCTFHFPSFLIFLFFFKISFIIPMKFQLEVNQISWFSQCVFYLFYF